MEICLIINFKEEWITNYHLQICLMISFKEEWITNYHLQTKSQDKIKSESIFLSLLPPEDGQHANSHALKFYFAAIK